MASSEVRSGLGTSIGRQASGLSSADRLCHACVELLDVDGAAISLIHAGSSQGTYGSSGEVSRRLDELQFTLGEGPCLDSVRQASPVLVPDFRVPAAQHWPAFAGAAQDLGVRAVFALPVSVATSWVGALDLFRNTPGPLSAEALSGGLWAAELAALPLLDLMTAEVDWSAAAEGGDGWSELASLARVEVYQATGMLMGQLDVDPTEALVRLRARAFAEGRSVSDVAWDIIERRLSLRPGDGWDGGPPDTGPAP